MAIDLGYFLDAFNPMDFIKGYEQSEKFATAQDLAKAQARLGAATADIGEVRAEEFKAPQFRETRRVQDEQAQFQAGLGAELARLSRDATRAQAPTLQRALETDIETQGFRSRAARDRARFGAEEETPFQIDERRGIIAQDTMTRDERLQERQARFKLAVADTAEKRFGVEGRQLARDVEMGVAAALRANPQASEYDALEAMKAGADDRKLTIINAYQRAAAQSDLIKASANPAGPQFEASLRRIDPNLRSLGPDPSGGMRIGYEVTDEEGNTKVVAAGLMDLSPAGVSDFVMRMSGRLPQTQRAAAARTTAAKPTPADARAEGAGRAGTPAAAAPTTTPAGVMGPPAPPARRTAQDVAGSYATEVNQLGAGVPAGADIATVGAAIEATREKLDKVHSDLRKELFGKPRNMEGEEAKALRAEMTAVEQQMRRLREMTNTIEDTLKKSAPRAKVRTVQELLATSGGRGASGKITQPVFGPGE